MENEKALKMLGLTPSCSISELNSTFRRLAKQYHPDFNRNDESRANVRMTELNLAYEMALEYLTSPDSENDESFYEAREVSFITRLNKSINRVLQGVYKYYQYGLENVHLRKEGVRKIRYRDSLTDLKFGIVSLESLKESAGSSSEGENLNLFIDFSKAFLMNMLIEKYYIPSSKGFNNTAHRHYYNGSVLLDKAIKEVFFGNLFADVQDNTYYNKICISYEEFMVIATRYNKSVWISETLMKIYLLEVLTKVIKLFKKMRY
ncbi:MAG TPA: J domain-containing protein [Spirochaetes bacterium]|nr:J domain-containing protein [Spirochaetota bacterium]